MTDAPPPAKSWITMPILSLIVAGLTGYFGSQLQRERELTETKGVIDALSLRVDIGERWRDRTELNRFTNRDGDQMLKLLSQRIDQHELVASHGVVGKRLNELEGALREIRAVLEIVRRDHKRYRSGEEVPPHTHGGGK